MIGKIHYQLNKISRIKLRCKQCFRFLQRITCKIIGLSPWTVDDNNIYSVSFVGLYYNILYCIILSVWSLHGVFNDPPATSPAASLFIVLKRILFVALVSSILIPLYYIAFVQQKRLISVYNRFAKVDEILKKCANYELRRNCTNDVIFSVNFVTIVFLVVISDMCYYIPSRVLFGCFPSVIGGCVMIQYAMLLNKIDSRFKSINSVILNISEPKISYECQFRESILYDIDNLQKAYMELYEMCYDAAKFYGISIIIAILCCAVRVIFTLYILILSAVYYQENYSPIWHVIGFRFFWVVFLFVVFTLSTTEMKKQVRKNLINLHFMNIVFLIGMIRR
ncbi:GSCOCT00013857001.3-RA-CDS [Cotesia congregata]|uniref:Gustatory receptor n=1 Tax=Cotesia congregata TaxID=51543 RepID=A0A8J2MGQ9_COTCN|nr:GSCOCT00013857001.3-RA-CDS [Cotesia congregata]CAG5089492.1 gustatory receptor 31 [Cotesia congregata]